MKIRAAVSKCIAMAVKDSRWPVLAIAKQRKSGGGAAPFGSLSCRLTASGGARPRPHVVRYDKSTVVNCAAGISIPYLIV